MSVLIFGAVLEMCIRDSSTASLSVGTKIVMPDTDNSGGDSVSLIRDSLFSIQVKQPWLLLQFGDTDTDMIGADRVESLISASPSENNGESRENAVKAEIEDNGNTNLTVTKAVNRLGTVSYTHLKEAVHDAFRQLIAQNRDGRIHALQISTESSIRAAQERSGTHASGKLRGAALRLSLIHI